MSFWELVCSKQEELNTAYSNEYRAGLVSVRTCSDLLHCLCFQISNMSNTYRTQIRTSHITTLTCTLSHRFACTCVRCATLAAFAHGRVGTKGQIPATSNLDSVQPPPYNSEDYLMFKIMRHNSENYIITTLCEIRVS